MAGTSIKVLIVDDSKAARELLCATLEEIPDTEVHEAVSGFDALKVADLTRAEFEEAAQPML